MSYIPTLVSWYMSDFCSCLLLIGLNFLVKEIGHTIKWITILNSKILHKNIYTKKKKRK